MNPESSNSPQSDANPTSPETAEPALPETAAPAAPQTTGPVASDEADSDDQPLEEPVDASFGPQEEARLYPIRIELPLTNYTSGQAFDMPVNLKSSARADHLTFDIVIDDEKFDFLEFLPDEAIPAGALKASESEPGRVSIVLEADGRVPGEALLGQLRLLSRGTEKENGETHSMKVEKIEATMIPSPSA